MLDPKHAELLDRARELVADKNIDDCARLLCKNFAKAEPKYPPSSNFGIPYIWAFVKCWLSQGRYDYVAKLCWPETLFDLRPASVQSIWKALPEESELIVQGAGSMSKSYTMAAWLLLDWLRDPVYTCVNIVSVTAEHARRNVFAHIKNLHAKSALPLPGIVKERSITVNNDAQQGIHLVAVPQGEDGAGRLQGLHVVPRKKPHELFGTVSRIRAILDEAEEIPSGVWHDIDNFLIGKSDKEHIKVFCAANPRDRSSLFGQRCEPKDGWMSVSIDDSYSWISKLGWKILRLDGATCENVTEKKLIYPGLITWEGFQRYLALGLNNPEYYTMARGWFPEADSSLSVIPSDLVQRNFGTVGFSNNVFYCAAVDLAFEGGDRAVMTIGRYGLAEGWQPIDRAYVKFNSPKYVLQIESQFDLEKGKTEAMTNDIITKCNTLNIRPQFLIVDRTGNGTGVHDLLQVKFGHEVIGLNFGTASTDTRILEEDTQKASELYDGVVTELFFATRKFLEFDHLKFVSHGSFNTLVSELTSRRYRQSTQGRVRVESKANYKKRGFKSPDFADSATLLVHLVRLRSDFVASMGYHELEYPSYNEEISGANKLDFIDFQN